MHLITDLRRHARKAVRIVAVVCATWFGTEALSFVLLFISDYDFFPSPYWVAASEGFGFIAGVIGALVAMLVILTGIYKSGPGDVLKKIGATLVSPFIGYYLGHATVVVTWPMIVGLVAGSQIELTYIVERADWVRNCGYAIEVRGPPNPFHRICHVPQSAREGLVPGSQILARGRGTRLGIYLESWNRME